jgi:hypothetical protein
MRPKAARERLRAMENETTSSSGRMGAQLVWNEIAVLNGRKYSEVVIGVDKPKFDFEGESNPARKLCTDNAACSKLIVKKSEGRTVLSEYEETLAVLDALFIERLKLCSVGKIERH